MRKSIALVACIRLLPVLLVLVGCGTPPTAPPPPGVDESHRRPVNARADVELQRCTNELHNTRLLQTQAERRWRAAAATLSGIAAPQRAPVPLQATRLPAEFANRVFTVQVGFTDTTLSVPDDIAAALLPAARDAPLIMLRGPGDNGGDTPVESRGAQSLVNEVRDYLVAAGVDRARIRVTYLPAGDASGAIDDSASSADRPPGRRVEIELYGVRPVVIEPTAVPLP